MEIIKCDRSSTVYTEIGRYLEYLENNDAIPLKQSRISEGEALRRGLNDGFFNIPIVVIFIVRDEQYCYGGIRCSMSKESGNIDHLSSCNGTGKELIKKVLLYAKSENKKKITLDAAGDAVVDLTKTEEEQRRNRNESQLKLVHYYSKLNFTLTSGQYDLNQLQSKEFIEELIESQQYIRSGLMSLNLDSVTEDDINQL